MTSYQIFVRQSDIDDLRARLARTRLPNVPEAANGHGFPLTTMTALLAKWREFDWRAVERRLNELPQQILEIDGVPVHVVVERAERDSDALPVVLLHGWPDTFFGVHRLIAPLVAAGHDVIVPSLPGYAFSGQSAAAMTTASIAETIDTVVRKLGIERYAVQGGDWGGAIAEQLALTRPERIAAIHLTDVPFHHQFMIEKSDASDDAEREFLESNEDWGAEGGYAAIQSTQPLTLAYGLADSPAGLLAWIGEKYAAWTDREPDVDDVLTQASIYWFSNTIWSSMRLYAEGANGWDDVHDTQSWGGDFEGVEPLGRAGSDIGNEWGQAGDAESAWTAPVCAIPAGFAMFPADINPAPRVFAERFFSDIRRFSLMPAGGHFAAREEPAALAFEIIQFLAPLR